MSTTDTAPLGELTTRDYWDHNWDPSNPPGAVDPRDASPESHYFAVMHRLFERARRAGRTDGRNLIEIGCGGSRWLPYFHRAFGFDVAGIDFSTPGLELARAILAREGVAADLALGDFFNPPAAWIGRFDMVVSFGLVEHFDDTPRAVAACGRYLRAGGTMVTLVPTMQGLYGTAYRLLNPAVYRRHRPLSVRALADAHERAGLQVLHTCHVLGLPGLLTPYHGQSTLRRAAFGLSRLYWRMERAGFGIPPNRFTSPYAVCIAGRMGDPAAGNEAT